MPTYDYRCGACGHTFEHFQSISDARLKKCPQCGKPKLERLIGAGGGLLFKGSGFYITDYRSSSYQEAAKRDATPASGDASKPAADAKATSDAKPSGDAKPAGESAKPAASGGAKPAAKAPASKPASGKSGGGKSGRSH